MENKYKSFIDEHYNKTEEDIRFDTKSHLVEYLTTMRYIEKYAKKGCKILEVGAGTGNYSINLAKKGYNVTSVELVENNLKILQKKSKGLDNIVSMQGDALDLSRFKDNTFDIVLNLGPMYHLFDKKSRVQAVKESIRVCKKGGVCMFAYLPHQSVLWYCGVRAGIISQMKPYIRKDGSLDTPPNEIFASFFIEEFEDLFKNTDTTFIKNVSTDSLFSLMRDYIDGKMSETDYQTLLDYHFATCERVENLGFTAHILYICKKNK